MKREYLLVKSPTVEDDDDDLSDIESSDNSIYFYTAVSKKSILNLNKQIRKTNKELVATAFNLEIEIPEIKLYINSPGGLLLDCFDGVDTIRNRKAPKHSIV